MQWFVSKRDGDGLNKRVMAELDDVRRRLDALATEMARDPQAVIACAAARMDGQERDEQVDRIIEALDAMYRQCQVEAGVCDEIVQSAQHLQTVAARNVSSFEQARRDVVYAHCKEVEAAYDRHIAEREERVQALQHEVARPPLTGRSNSSRRKRP